MKRLLHIMLVGAILCILLAFVLLVVFKVSGFTGVAAAYVVGGFAVLGGILLVLSTLLMFIKGNISDARLEKLSFHLPELIGVGVLMIFFGVILFVGKIIM